MSVEELKEAVEAVAKSADGLAESLSDFRARSSQRVEDAKEALKGTGQGVDAQVAASLDEAGTSIQAAETALEDAAQSARNYLNQL